MAYLSEQPHQQRCYLYAYHSFGRLAYTVETHIAQPHISKVHAVVQWQNNQWAIKDLSRNGSWLNGKKLVSERLTALKIGDNISFSGAEQSNFVVTDLTPPADMLIPCAQTSMNKYNAISGRPKGP